MGYATELLPNILHVLLKCDYYSEDKRQNSETDIAMMLSFTPRTKSVKQINIYYFALLFNWTILKLFEANWTV